MEKNNLQDFDEENLSYQVSLELILYIRIMSI